MCVTHVFQNPAYTTKNRFGIYYFQLHFAKQILENHLAQNRREALRLARKLVVWMEDNSSNEDGFKIDRCKGATCTNFSQIATVVNNVENYSNTGLQKNTTYRYRVRAYNSGGDSAYTDTASAKTPSR